MLVARLKPCKMKYYERSYAGAGCTRILPELRKLHKKFMKIEYCDNTSIFTRYGFTHPKKDFIIKEIP